VLVAAGCGAPSRKQEVAPPQSLAKRCGTAVASPNRTFWFRSRDGVRLDGGIVGSGSTAVVLAHQYPSDLCPWLDYAGVLARSGFSAFLFDFRGFGQSAEPKTASATWRLQDDVAGAVQEARQQGARHVFLVGASMGACAVAIAAPTIRPAVDGVVSLSAEWNLDGLLGSRGLNLSRVARRVDLPWVLATGSNDRNPTVSQTKALADRASGPTQVVVVPDGGHGWSLLQASPKLVRMLAYFFRRPA
jgi:alpha-beta hydrolase superfamily lysophospholipase